MDLLQSLFALFGRLHPMMVHFPIGLLLGALILETWAIWRNQTKDYAGLVYLGAITTIFSTLMGQSLVTNEDFSGQLVDWHRIAGYVTAAFATITAISYFFRERLSTQLPYGLLWITSLMVGAAGHWGASITHGSDYLSDVFVLGGQDEEEINALLAEIQQSDSLSLTELDRLNLEVRAIFAHNCYQCHSTAKRKGGLALDHQEGVFAGGDSGPIFVAGHADESEMMHRLTISRADEASMPPKGKSLKKSEIELIKLWINTGAHWASEEFKIFREAPMALVPPVIPPQTNELDHPIDRFVNQYFEENKLEWPGIIDDHKFIRRAYLDVVGLLPKPEMVKAFLDNPDVDKRAALIDSLLADQQNYTTHWLSFWNDLLRNDYSGTGYITGGRKQISDWLFKALLRNMPYDEMARELVNPTPESEGFIKGIKWRGVVNASQRTELQAAQNVAQSLMGVNLKCASCHNSFINNLTLDQAYGFANIFAEAPLEIYRCDKTTGRIAQTAFLYPELGEVVGDSIKDRLKSLAGIMVKPENGRMYRTIVNRYWDRLFGRGIVAPVDEMDNLPWHQELLDWLALEFIDSGYDLKQLLRMIMTSDIYQSEAYAYPSQTYLASEKFKFQGPSVRRMTAEQFVDAFAQVVQPLYHGLTYVTEKSELPTQWIWYNEIEVDRRVLPKPGTRLFRKSFQLENGPSLINAKLLVTADHAFELWINDQHISSGEDWREVRRMELPVDLFRKENILAVKGVNEGAIPNPAGLLLALQLTYADSSVQIIHSDRSWKTSKDTTLLKWQTVAFDDSDWEQVRQFGSVDRSYWGKLLDFTFEDLAGNDLLVRAALVKQDEFMKTLGRPVRENVVTHRDDNATLLQSLMLTNSDFFHEAIHVAAGEWEKQFSTDPERGIRTLYFEALGRAPTEKEVSILMKALKKGETKTVLEDILWTIMVLPEFQLI